MIDQQTVSLWVDTDIGVDDAVAIAWLLRQQRARIVGFSTVAGNTSVENATRNLLTLQGVLGQSLPVTIGAGGPLELSAPRLGPSAFVHGPTGLWQAQAPIDLAGLPSDAPAALAAAARAYPDLTILALGPLTNLAAALRTYPDELAGVPVIALAGARRGGNRTQVAEFNAYYDPHALAELLERAGNVTLIPLDAFEQLTFDREAFPRQLAQQSDPIGRFLAGPLVPYLSSLAQGQRQQLPIPDLVAAIYALHPEYGQAASALVEVVVDSSIARGQTIIATDVQGRVQLLADEAELESLAQQAFSGQPFDLATALGAILMRRPDNARVVLQIDTEQMRAAIRQM
jgi:inosine-uridine nucleoside N-ribohydrolase